MNLPVVYTHMVKLAEEATAEPPEFTAEQWNPGPNATPGQRTYADWLHRYYDRTQEYAGEVTTKKHRWAQSLGMISSALIGALGGAVIGGIAGGGRGARVGAMLGVPLGLGADAIGAAIGLKEPARSRDEQLAYQNSNNGIAEELLIPGYAGYQRGRSARHINSVVSKEIPDKVMKSKVRNFNDVAPT